MDAVKFFLSFLSSTLKCCFISEGRYPVAMRLNQESTIVPGKIGHKLFILGKILIKEIAHVLIAFPFLILGTMQPICN